VEEAKRETYHQSRVAAQGGGFTTDYGVEQLASFNRVSAGQGGGPSTVFDWGGLVWVTLVGQVASQLICLLLKPNK
jgi:hypothetical protein